MPRKQKQTKAYDPRKLHRDLKKAGLQVISCDENGVVILKGIPTPEQVQQVASIKANHHRADYAAND